ncbi:MAG: hypothetical protein GX984_06305 [Erysipelothrix sp.]|nr:hypothetical protein [Erysipelothrix sp.]
MSQKQYIAIIGDIIDSKKIIERKQFQNQFEKLLNKINDRYQDSIQSNFTITLGDEFQGLLIDYKNLLNIIHDINMSMYPIKIRFGIGIGEMSTEIYSDKALGSDGPAYHHARAAINYVHKNEDSNATYYTSVALCPNDNVQSQLLNLSLTNYSLFLKDWNEAQFHTVRLMQEYKNQTRVADKLNITQQAVVKRLQRSNYYNFDHLFHSLNQILEEWS